MGTQYATEAQIEANLKGADFSAANSTVDSAAMVDLIAEESTVIDQHIQAHYTLPVTDADSLIFLRKICIDLVVYRVAKILMPREQKFLPDGKIIQDISYSGAWRKAMAMLKEISKGDLTLPGQVVEAKTFVSSTLETDGVVQIFERNVKQW